MVVECVIGADERQNRRASIALPVLRAGSLFRAMRRHARGGKLP
jgi:hypothetical protein